VVERHVGALVIPRQALRGSNEVAVVQGGMVRLRTVTIGLQQGALVEVTTGLREGEPVVVLGPETLTEGQPVRTVAH